MTAMNDTNDQGSNGNGTYIRNNLGSHLQDGSGSASTICVPEPMGSTDFIREFHVLLYLIIKIKITAKYCFLIFKAGSFLSLLNY